MVRLSVLFSAAALVALFLAGDADARGWVWIKQAGPNPVAAIGDGKGSSISVTCLSGRDPVDLLVARGPARGLKAGRGVKAVIEGRRRVPFRFDSVRLEPGGVAQLTSRAGYRGSTGDQSGTLEAIESMATARGPITVASGGFRFSVTSLGAKAAMAPLIKRCGNLKSMIKRAEAREGELN